MRDLVPLEILSQPDDSSCGPTCLHAIYRLHGDHIELEQLMREVPRVATGGTLAVLLANHALARGYDCELFTFNLEVFDPSWFGLPRDQLLGKLESRGQVVTTERTRDAVAAYHAFVEQGGKIRFEDLTVGLIRGYLQRGVPILCGLSATYLYQTQRERGEPAVYDDVRGEPAGHFVILRGYDPKPREVIVADPLRPNPLSDGSRYHVPIDRLVCSIMLGVLTYDGNLLVIRPKKRERSLRR